MHLISQKCKCKRQLTLKQTKEQLGKKAGLLNAEWGLPWIGHESKRLGSKQSESLALNVH